MYNCKCEKNNWEWQIDDNMSTWVRCKDCGESMFGKDIGVILINWGKTDVVNMDLRDFLRANLYMKALGVKL